jgi:hypothetical protein
MRRCGVLALLAGAACLLAAEGPAAEVRSDDTLCLTYHAKLDGSYLVIRAAIESPWHTFALDNKKRVEEKLAGKKSLGTDQPTEFTVTGGLELAGPWLQTEPKDFSRPALRWFSYGFERQAVFAAKVRRTGVQPLRIAVRGQACTDTICKNIDAAMTVPTTGAKLAGDPTEIKLSDLIPVR